MQNDIFNLLSPSVSENLAKSPWNGGSTLDKRLVGDIILKFLVIVKILFIFFSQ